MPKKRGSPLTSTRENFLAEVFAAQSATFEWKALQMPGAITRNSADNGVYCSSGVRVEGAINGIALVTEDAIDGPAALKLAKEANLTDQRIRLRALARLAADGEIDGT